MIAAGALSGVSAAAGWSGIGLRERVNVGAFGLWQIATALYLMGRI